MGEPAVENVFETQDPYYITNENAKFENTRVYTAGIWWACEQHTPERAGGEFGPTLREKYGNLFFGVPCLHTYVHLCNMLTHHKAAAVAIQIKTLSVSNECRKTEVV